jgi:hypothetical protein
VIRRLASEGSILPELAAGIYGDPTQDLVILSAHAKNESAARIPTHAALVDVSGEQVSSVEERPPRNPEDFKRGRVAAEVDRATWDLALGRMKQAEEEEEERKKGGTL